jgi:hypothetical protein
MDGTIANFRSPGMRSPDAMTAGPDGAMWFTMFNTLGRIATSVTPAILGMAPRSGPPGTRVTIIGRDLAPLVRVAFNGTTAGIVSHTATRVVATVPADATTGSVSVRTPIGTAVSALSFDVT